MRTLKKPSKKSVKKSAKRLPAKPTRKPIRKPTKLTRKPTSIKSRSIIETSSVTWSSKASGPSFDQVQIAAYHRWIEFGGDEVENWLSAEGDLRKRMGS